MIVPLRTLCLALAALLFALAPSARAAGGDCCGAHANAGHVAVADAATHVDSAHGDHGCCCGSACHCAQRTQASDCHCKAPTRKPQSAPPVVPKLPVPGSAPVHGPVPEVPPHLTVAQRLCAATASGLPNVLLPNRSRQVALSVWLC